MATKDKDSGAVDARSPDLGELQDLTPTQPGYTGTQYTGAQAGESVAKQGYFEVVSREAGVLMQFEGRKSRNGYRMPPVPGEHIDVTVPDDANVGAAAMYIERLLSGPHNAEWAEALDKMKDKPDDLHLSGHTYHFVCRGKATIVRPADVAFLEASPSYFITTVESETKDAQK